MAVVLFGLVRYGPESSRQTLADGSNERPGVTLKYSLRGDFELELCNLPGAAMLICDFLQAPWSSFVASHCPCCSVVIYRSTLDVQARAGEDTAVNSFIRLDPQWGHFRVLGDAAPAALCLPSA